MKRWFLIALISLSLAVFGVSASVAQDDPGEGFGEGVSRALATCPTGQVAKHVVPFLNSIANTAGQRSAGVITLLNNSNNNTCDWTIVWKLSRSNAISRTDTRNNVTGGFSYNFCSRPIPTALTFCNDAAPSLTFNEMSATICVTDTFVCRRVGVSARNYITTGDTDNLAGVNDLRVLRVNKLQRGD